MAMVNLLKEASLISLRLSISTRLLAYPTPLEAVLEMVGACKKLETLTLIIHSDGDYGLFKMLKEFRHISACEIHVTGLGKASFLRELEKTMGEVEAGEKAENEDKNWLKRLFRLATTCKRV